MKILACDCSSKLIGCIQLENKSVLQCMLYGGSKNDFETRLKVLFVGFRELIDKWKPDVIYIEQAVYVQNVKATLMIDAVVNLVRFVCIDKAIPYQIVDNTVWKKDVLGNGKASKEQITEFVRARESRSFEIQDLCDAYCLSLFGQRRLA
mgnify:CR=1 FL=1